VVSTANATNIPKGFTMDFVEVGASSFFWSTMTV
jgi:hypothetical protein